MRRLKEDEGMDDLAFAFRRLAEISRQHAGPQAEETLRRKFRARVRRQRLYLGSAAAILALIAGYFTANQTHKTIRPEPDAAQVLAGFMPLPYAGSGAPLGETVILRVDLPVESVEINSAGSAAERTRFVPADLMIGEDGIPRAVRFAQ